MSQAQNPYSDLSLTFFLLFVIAVKMKASILITFAVVTAFLPLVMGQESGCTIFCQGFRNCLYTGTESSCQRLKMGCDCERVNTPAPHRFGCDMFCRSYHNCKSTNGGDRGCEGFRMGCACN